MKISIIIPTFGRSENVIFQTLDSIFECENDLSIIQDIILIDQNHTPLKIQPQYSKKLIKNTLLEVITVYRHGPPSYSLIENNILPIIHITGGEPSVTKAKNFGINTSKGEYLVFLDDDVVLQKNCLSEHISSFQSHDHLSFVGGREIVHPTTLKRSSFREFLIKMYIFFSKNEEDDAYKIDDKYVGRIKTNSLMFSHFDIVSDEFPKIDGARGCNWSTSKTNVLKAGMFDEKFKGTALREETDLYLRIKNLFGPGIFNSKASVIHMRQLGGCNNISKSLATLQSKFNNELYFQQKHFSNVSSVFFSLRTLPTAIEATKDTFGYSLVIWIKFSFKFLFSKKI